jgi:hypothetical protein
MSLAQARKKNWETVKMTDLRKLAPEFGVKSKGLKKAELIHKMRMAYWSSR